MSSVNKKRDPLPLEKTHGGVIATQHISALQQLRRSVLSCMLWENEFYEDGESIAARIESYASRVTQADLAALAVEARAVHNLRHVSLLLLIALIKRGGSIVRHTIERVIQRADELTELIAMYWKDGKRPLSAQMKKGLAEAFQKFDAYQLAKYDRDNKTVRLRDVLFLTHAKPKNEQQAAVWKQLVDGTLPSPDTWEVALSAGGDKKAEFTRLLTENKLGYLALLRNLRNMTDAGVDTTLIHDAIITRKGGAERVLPFRYVAAARACPQMEPSLDKALVASISATKPLTGTTIVLVDVSGSMDEKLSGKSDLTRADAAAALASVLNGNLRVFSFSDKVIEVPPRRGMAGVDAILRSQSHQGTRLADAVAQINRIPHDRLIVITDEQATDNRVPRSVAKHRYMINVASYKNGVGYGTWTHIDGFSEAVIKYIYAVETQENDNVPTVS